MQFHELSKHPEKREVSDVFLKVTQCIWWQKTRIFTSGTEDVNVSQFAYTCILWCFDILVGLPWYTDATFSQSSYTSTIFQSITLSYSLICWCSQNPSSTAWKKRRARQRRSRLSNSRVSFPTRSSEVLTSLPSPLQSPRVSSAAITASIVGGPVNATQRYEIFTYLLVIQLVLL